MKVYYDIHIHSILSACADELQTPNNILNMCMLKELNMISICDHNCAKQWKTLDMLRESYDFFMLYGMEITVKEGFHVLAYFEKYDELMKLDEIIDECLDKTIIPPDKQIICDEYDEPLQEIPYWTNQKIKYSFKEVIDVVKANNGIIIPAHIDRRNSGILDFYSDFSIFDVDGIEVYDLSIINDLYDKYPYLKNYKVINNSDAHSMELIHEKEQYMDLDDLSFNSFKKWLHE